MRLYQDGDRYIFDCTYQERPTPRSAGFKFDPATRQWFTTDDSKAARLKAFADTDLRAALTQAAIDRIHALNHR
jgi:hypothetical protein